MIAGLEVCLLLVVSLLLSNPVSAQDATAGQKLYQANCMACHGDTGDGNGPAAIALDPKPRNFTDAAFWTGQTDTTLSTSIMEGKPGTAMAGFAQLSEQDVANLIAYLKTLQPK